MGTRVFDDDAGMKITGPGGLIVVLGALLVTACGSSKRDLYSSPAPTKIETPAPETQPVKQPQQPPQPTTSSTPVVKPPTISNTGSNDQGGNIPAPTVSPAPRPQPQPAAPAPAPRPLNPSQGSNLPSQPAPRSSLAERPLVRGTPAESWLYHDYNPVLKTLRSLPSLGQAPMSRKKTITWALGYFDGFLDKPLVYQGRDYGKKVPVDSFHASILEQILADDCKSGMQLCEFYLDKEKDGVMLFSKLVESARGEEYVELRVLQASLTPDAEVNLGEGRQEQAERARSLRDQFLASFGNSELVLYVGHSRYGGGPDFGPAKYRADGQIDEEAHAKDRRSAQALVVATSAKSRQAKAFALLSCAGTEHFSSEISKRAPNLQLMLSVTDTSAVDQMTTGLAATELWLRDGNWKRWNQLSAQLAAGKKYRISGGVSANGARVP